MLTMLDIRNKYPSYNDMSDEELANALHKKYYSDMDKGAFYSKIGFEPKSAARQGLENIGKDWSRFAKNLGIGVTELGRGLANTPHNVANLFGQGDKVANLVDPEFDYAQAFGMTEEPTLGDTLTRGLAQYAPALALPGASLGRAGTTIGSLGRGGKFLQGALEQAVPQAAFGATQNENPLSGALESGVGSIAGSALGAGLEKGFNALRPSKLLRGELSPAELKRSLKVTKGTQTGLGRVINSPTLARMQENILPHVIGSGAYKSMGKNAANIQEMGAKQIKKYAGNLQPENYGEKIKEALINSYRDVEKVKGEKFGKVNKLADEAKVTTNRDNLRKTANDLLEQINLDSDLAKFVDSSDKKLIQELAGKGEDASQNVSLITGKPLAPKGGHSIKNTDILRGKIGRKAYEASYKGETDRASIYGKLKESLEKDVKDAIENSSSQELKKAHTDAMDYYRNEYAAYKDKDIQKFIKQGGDPDLILSHFIKGGKNDRATLLQKLSKGVRQQPNGTDNILASSYLSRAIDSEGQLNPLKLKTLYHDLGKNQRNALFGKGDMHKSIKDYVDLVGKNTEGFNLMFNANNGQRNIDLLAKIGQLSASLAHGGGTAAFLAPLVGLGVSSRIANKVLSNQNYREKLVNAMIKGQTKELPKAAKNALQKGGAITAGLSGNDKKQKPMELLVTKGR